MIKLFMMGFMLVLTACAGNEIKQPPSVVSIKIPVLTSCVKDLPIKPPFINNQDYRKLDGAQKAYMLWGERELHMGYESELEAILNECKKD